MQQPVGVLFIHPHTKVMSDSGLYADIMRCIDPERFRCFVACAEAPASDQRAPINLFRCIPGVTVLPTTFPPSLRSASSPGRLAAISSALPALGDKVCLAHTIARHNIRILHSSEAPRETTYNLLLSRATGARMVVHIHAIVGAWLGKISRFNLRYADALVPVSQAAARSALAAGFRADRVRPVLNGIDLRRWRPGADRDAARAELGIPAGVPVITTVARVYPDKGHAEVLRALAQIKDSVGDFRYLIVGDDDRGVTPGSASWTAHLKTLTAELGLTERVIFAGYRGDVERILAASDIYAMPSRSEALGLCYLETSAMRLPVIASDTTGIPEAVEHGLTGLLAPYGDQTALAAHLCRLLADPELGQTMGAAGRRRVEQRFTSEQMTRRIEEVYAGLFPTNPYGRLRTN